MENKTDTKSECAVVVFVARTDGLYPGDEVGFADSMERAKKMATSAGYTVIDDGEGGHCELVGGEYVITVEGEE